MKAPALLLIAFAVSSVLMFGCAQPNRLVGTWTIVGTDPSLPSVLIVRKLVITDNAVELYGEGDKGTTVPLTTVNDHTATMPGLFGAVISFELEPSGELHLTDPDSRFRRSN